MPSTFGRRVLPCTTEAKDKHFLVFFEKLIQLSIAEPQQTPSRRYHSKTRPALVLTVRYEQFNTPMGRITYNIVQIKSKREKNQLQA